MPQTYTHEEFDDWSMAETPKQCMYYGKYIDPCGEPATRKTALLTYFDGCKGRIYVCDDEKHWPPLKLSEGA